MSDVNYDERVQAKGCNGPYEINRKGEVFNAKTGKQLKLRLSANGYLYFTDCCNGVQKSKFVHQIMLPSFDVLNPDNKPTVNHKNGIKTDNRIENLEWYTYQEQMAHARDVLGRKIGYQKGHPSPMQGKPKPENSGKLPRPVRGIHRKTGEVREFESISEAARQVGGNNGNICLACQCKQQSSAGYRWEYID